MKKLTFSEVRRLEADLRTLEFLKSQYALGGFRYVEMLASNTEGGPKVIFHIEEMNEKINQIKSLLSLHYGKD